MKKIVGLVVAMIFLVILILFGGAFIKPPQIEKYQDIKSWETAFVIPLEQDISKQVKLDSISAYEKAKVPSKRVPIPTEWRKMGRMRGSGVWVETVSVITVDRSPVARLWTEKTMTGTSVKNEAINIESRDSVGFSAPFNCTAYIPEEWTAIFLYYYQSRSLAQILDEEIRNKIQNVATTFCTQYDMDTLREKKYELNLAVRDVVVPYCEQKGIKIITLGLAGYFQYNNPDNQKSIDSVFISQQEKNVEKALLESMASKELVKQGEGEAEANKTREEANGKRDAKVIEAQGKAQGMKHVMNALRRAQQSPMFLAVKGLEVEMNRIEKWNGEVPSTILGEGGALPLITLQPQNKTP